MTAPCVREVDELPGGLRGRARAGDVEDLGRRDEIAEAVRAQDEDVARDEEDRLRAHVDLDVLRDAERAHDLVRVGMVRRVLGLDDVPIDHLLDHGVVLGDLRNGSAVDEIDPAVSDVRDLRARGMREDRHDRRAGSIAALVGRHSPHATICFFDRDAQRITRSRLFRGRSDDLDDRLHRELGCLLASGVSAHAVADHREETELPLGVRGGVLVHLLVGIAPGIGAHGDLDRGRARQDVGLFRHGASLR